MKRMGGRKSETDSAGTAAGKGSKEMEYRECGPGEACSCEDGKWYSISQYY